MGPVRKGLNLYNSGKSRCGPKINSKIMMTLFVYKTYYAPELAYFYVIARLHGAFVATQMCIIFIF